MLSTLSLSTFAVPRLIGHVFPNMRIFLTINVTLIFFTHVATVGLEPTILSAFDFKSNVYPIPPRGHQFALAYQRRDSNSHTTRAGDFEAPMYTIPSLWHCLFGCGTDALSICVSHLQRWVLAVSLNYPQVPVTGIEPALREEREPKSRVST
jgi:hypothetical protein